jgi:purine catabolism regulator
MSISVRDLVATPSLSTRIIAGSLSQDNSINWAHVCELAEPWCWIDAGCLLMTTGIGIPLGSQEQIHYVQNLARARVAAIAIADGMQSPELTAEMLRIADTLGLPILLTQPEVPFIALARTVASANATLEQARLATTERLYKYMQSFASIDKPAQLLKSLGNELHAHLLLLPSDTSTAIPLLEHETHRLEIARRIITHMRRGDSAQRHDGGAISVRLPSPPSAVLIALPNEGYSLDLGLIQHAAAVIAAHRGASFASRERDRRLGASLLARMLDNAIDTTLAKGELNELELLQSRILATSHAEAEDRIWTEVHHALDDANIANALLTQGEINIAMLPADAQSLGIYARVQDTRAALQQAIWSLRRIGEGEHRIAHYSSQRRSSVFLPDDELDGARIARQILGPLFEQDSYKGSQLILSLRTFLEENRSWVKASARLFIHKQTLVYRMERVEELTGRRLSSTRDVAEFWMALEAAALSGQYEF